MKKHLLIFVIFLSVGAFLNNASAQQSANPRQSTAIPRKPTVPNQTVVDVRPQITAILNRKRDGKFLLYGDNQGTKVFLTVRGGKPGPIEAFDKDGIALPTRRNVNKSSAPEVCYDCWWVMWGTVPWFQQCIVIHCPLVLTDKQKLRLERSYPPTH